MNALAKINHSTELDLSGPATWDRVKYYADLASKFAHASTAAQAMAGFDLLELHKQHNIKPGQPKKELPNDLVILSWPELVKQHAGVSDECARNWMKMAGGVRTKWKKMAPQSRLRQLMSVPPSDWSEKDTLLIQDALHKATDGLTQTEFLRELGLAKKPPGNPNAKGGGEKKKLSISEEAALRKQQATEDWAEIERMLKVYRDKFALLTDTEILAQMNSIELALKARRKWITPAVGQRDSKAITDLFDNGYEIVNRKS